MHIYTADTLSQVWETLKARLKNGQVGIIPTDTIYGITGNASDEGVVRRVIQIKQRKRPLSFIPHSLDWLKCLIEPAEYKLFDKYVGRYKGPYTTLWTYSGQMAQLPIELRSTGLVGVRLPKHWICDLAAEIKLPLLSTSVNISGQTPMTSLDDLNQKIKAQVDFIVYTGPLNGPPSTLIHCYDALPFREEPRQL